MTPLRVLYVEDDPDDVTILLRVLQQAGRPAEVVQVDTAAALREALADDGWDVVLSDYVVPGFGAPEALGIVRASGHDLPFIVVSGAVGEERAVEMMRAGAADYVSKHNLQRLVPVIDRERAQARVRRARETAEETIRLNAAQYQRLLDGIGEHAIYLLDAAGHVVSWNRGAERIKGYTADEAIGLPYARFFTDADRAEGVPEAILRQAAEEGRYEGQGWRQRKNGERFWADAALHALRAADGSLWGFAKIARDVTERRRAEAHLRVLEAAVDAVTDAIIITDTHLAPPGPRILFANPAFEQMTGYGTDEVLGETPRVLHGPATDRAELDRLKRCLARDEPFHGEVVNYRKDGTPFVLEWTVNPVRVDHEEATHYVAVQRDVTERRQAEGRLRQYASRLAVLRELDAAILEARSIREIAQAGVTHLRRMIPEARFALIRLPPGEPAAVIAAADPPGMPMGTHLPLSELPPLPTGTDTVMAYEDLAAIEPRFAVEKRMLAQGDRSALGVPVGLDGTVSALLVAVSQKPRHFTPEYQEMMQEVGRVLALALHSAQMTEELVASREQLRALSQRLVEVQEAERRHIGRELHDEIGQTLTALKILLQMEDNGSSTHAESLALVGELLGRVRRLTVELRPTALDDLGLVPALNWLAERFEKQTNIRVELFVFGLKERLPSAHDHALYRLVQEALTNVARHAGADEVRVLLQREGAWVHLLVEDAGQGFVPETVSPFASTGLSGMRERVMLLGGTFRLVSTPGKGTHVHASLPIPTQADPTP